MDSTSIIMFIPTEQKRTGIKEDDIEDFLRKVKEGD
jgi:hypothetical protein